MIMYHFIIKELFYIIVFQLKSEQTVYQHKIDRLYITSPVYSNKVNRPKLRWKFYAIAASILILAAIEHILSIAENSEKHDWSGKMENSTFANFLKVYCASSHAFVLDTRKSYAFLSLSIIFNLQAINRKQIKVS